MLYDSTRAPAKSSSDIHVHKWQSESLSMSVDARIHNFWQPSLGVVVFGPELFKPKFVAMSRTFSQESAAFRMWAPHAAVGRHWSLTLRLAFPETLQTCSEFSLKLLILCNRNCLHTVAKDVNAWEKNKKWKEQKHIYYIQFELHIEKGKGTQEKGKGQNKQKQKDNAWWSQS